VAGSARVFLDRAEVLDALYHQGRAALGRGDRAGAAVALAPVAEEAPERYPDAAAQLAQAQQPGPGDARDAPRGKNGVGLTNEPWQRGATVEGSSWAEDMRALGAALARGARRAADSPRLRPLGGKLANLAGPHGRRAWAVGALMGAVLLFVLFAERSGPTDTRAAGTPEAVAVPTVVPDAEVFARCDAAVAASNWADAVRECRTLQARDADYEGLADKLAAAYVGRGQQRLAQGDDLGAAKTDFEEALRFQPESTDAQTAFQRLYLYQEGDKALGAGDWETAIGQLGADYADAPDYLQSLADRSLEAKLFAAWLGWGHAALAADDNLSAAQRCSQALTLSPDDPDAQGCVDAARAAMDFD
jgi:tetratricopeptide (TPR) repeat protein